MLMKLIFILSFVSLSLADPLQAIEEAINKDGPKDNLADWVDPSTPFGRVLLNSGPESELSEWLAPSPNGIREHKRSVRRKPEYLQITHEYESMRSKALIRIRFYLPYPKYGPMTDYGLVSELPELFPPKRGILSSESILVGEIQADLYHEPRGACSILIKLPKYSFFEGTINDCTNSGELIGLIEALNLNPVIEKLKE